MASGAGQKKLIIEELPSSVGGQSRDRAARFEWDRSTMSSNRGPLNMPVKVRTLREDYAGTDEVTEQVLGSNYEPFTFQGVWDARRADPSTGKLDDQWAFKTYEAFEAMVRRANPVRITFEKLSYVGIITDFDPTYDKEWYIPWKFVLSPHFKKSGGDVRKTGVVPRQIPNPRVVAQQIAALVNLAASTHQAAPSPYMIGPLFTNVQTQLTAIAANVADFQNTVTNQLVPGDATSIQTSPVAGPGSTPVNSLLRMVQTLQSISNNSANLLYYLRGASSYSSASFVAMTGPYAAIAGTSASLAYDLAGPTMDFDVWRTGMGSIARQIVYQTNTLATALEAQVKPGIQSIYLPRPGESLYAISNKVYGTPDGWVDIFERNNLIQLYLQGTEVLIIPGRGTT